MNRKERLEKRNQKIYKDFDKMFNKDLIRPDVIYNRLADTYTLTPETVARIVSNQARQQKASFQPKGVP
ncbi:MAG TPA: hypothetical protein VL442_12855 [Mucilaginibacter sp.]|jgi:hypothetical protein|nr:hypothetical protein [Mucilaginibacter sp.]